MIDAKDCHRVSLKEKIDSARNVNKLRRSNTDCAVEKSDRKERRPTDMAMAIASPLQRQPSFGTVPKEPELKRGSSLDPAALGLKRSESKQVNQMKRVSSFEPATLRRQLSASKRKESSMKRGSSFGRQLSELRHKKAEQLYQSDARKSMKDMDPSKILAMLETLAVADGDQADECLQVLKNSVHETRSLPKRTRTNESAKSKSAKSA